MKRDKYLLMKYDLNNDVKCFLISTSNKEELLNVINKRIKEDDGNYNLVVINDFNETLYKVNVKNKKICETKGKLFNDIV